MMVLCLLRKRRTHARAHDIASYNRVKWKGFRSFSSSVFAMVSDAVRLVTLNSFVIGSFINLPFSTLDNVR